MKNGVKNIQTASVRYIMLNFGTISVGGCWSKPMLLFWKLVDETQMPQSEDFRTASIQILACIFLSVRDNSKSTFQYEAPCSTWPHCWNSVLQSRQNENYCSQIVFWFGLWVDQNKAQFWKNKTIPKLKLSKNVIITRCTEKKIRMLWLIFGVNN